MEPQAVLPPANEDSEEYVLGACLLSETAILACSEVLSPEDFSRPSNGAIFRACAELMSRGEPIDALTVAEHLKKHGRLENVGGRKRVHELAALVPATHNAPHHAKIVRKYAVRRGLAEIGAATIDLAHNGVEPEEGLERVEAMLFDLAKRKDRRELERAGDSIRQTYDEIVKRYESGDEVCGLSTGYPSLDKLTLGLEPGNLVIVAARPSMGKSALAFNISYDVAVRRGLPVLLFTLEMSKKEVNQRLLGAETGIPGERIRSGRLKSEEFALLAKVAGEIEGAPFYVEEASDLTILEMRARARRLQAKQPLALIIVDYIQLMAGDGRQENRTQEVSHISRQLKVLAGALEVPVIALSQLSRAVEGRTDKRPVLSDLRESGSIEQDADLVLFIYREDYYSKLPLGGMAELILAKHRNGPTDTARLLFSKEIAKFSELAR